MIGIDLDLGFGLNSSHHNLRKLDLKCILCMQTSKTFTFAYTTYKSMVNRLHQKCKRGRIYCVIFFSSIYFPFSWNNIKMKKKIIELFTFGFCILLTKCYFLGMNCLHHLNLLRPLEVLQTAFGVISQKTKKWECASPSTQRVGTDGAPDTAMDQTRPLSSAKFLVSMAGEHLHSVEDAKIYSHLFFCSVKIHT